MKLFEAIKRLFSRWFGRKQQTPVQHVPASVRVAESVKMKIYNNVPPMPKNAPCTPSRNKNRIPDDCFRFLTQAAKKR